MNSPRVDFVKADSAWNQVDFLSDIHLDDRELATFEAWREYMSSTPADAIFILGDLFEIWVGDDTTDAFQINCLEILENSSKNKPVYVMHGNRDFLLGRQRSYAFELLDDPCVLDFETDRLLLSHGDAWCIDDKPYQEFRKKVRTKEWMQEFLKQDWETRQSVGQAMRNQSLAHHATQPAYADVDNTEALKALHQHDCKILVHGHTHRPATHDIDGQHQRWVLSDWHAQSTPPRLEILRWNRKKQTTLNHRLERIQLDP
jgi:UDP-2,3-diacylglucosamine hydrolase